MSKVTDSSREASVSCGFYDGADREYYASDLTQIVDGIINDGVFASIGTCFAVKAGSGLTVNVGVGKAWFNSTWTINDAILPLNCAEVGELHPLQDRIDAVIIEIDTRQEVRDNFIKIIPGANSTNPVRPELNTVPGVYQYPLCYVHIHAGSKQINQADITNMVGTKETPFVTGILQTVSLDELLGQWQDDLNRFVATEKQNTDEELTEFMAGYQQDYEEWTAEMADIVTKTNKWTEEQQASILGWFNTMKDQLSVDGAINLQLQIDEEEIKRILLCGLVDGTKTISDDGLRFETIDSKGRTLITEFTSDFSELHTTLYDKNGAELGSLYKSFSEDGKTITTTTTIEDVSLVNGDELEY